MKPCAVSSTRRRSKLSATAPAASEKIMTGSVVEACTRATRSADPVIEVISQAAPTDWMRLPRFDAKLASHTARKTGWLKGASAAGRSVTGLLSPPLVGLRSNAQARETEREKAGNMRNENRPAAVPGIAQGRRQAGC